VPSHIVGFSGHTVAVPVVQTVGSAGHLVSAVGQMVSVMGHIVMRGQIVSATSAEQMVCRWGHFVSTVGQCVTLRGHTVGVPMPLEHTVTTSSAAQLVGTSGHSV